MKKSLQYILYTFKKKNHNDNMDLLIICDEKSYEETDTLEQCKINSIMYTLKF